MNYRIYERLCPRPHVFSGGKLRKLGVIWNRLNPLSSSSDQVTKNSPVLSERSVEEEEEKRREEKRREEKRREEKPNYS